MKLLDYFKFFLKNKNSFYTFVSGHAYLDKKKINTIKKNAISDDKKIVLQYEELFSSIIGKGSSISFASARMGFYSLMIALNIKQNDEIIVLGATCSVIINAIMRIGAIPIYSDIDPETFGSDLECIKKVRTHKTKIILAQHSFGIPCNIQPIKEYCNNNNIFLIEDCALTVSSKINGITVGNFGIASIFSTDHGKPINTVVGGLVYTKDKNLYDKLKKIQSSAPQLPYNKKNYLLSQFILELKFLNPSKYKLFKIIYKIKTILNKNYKPFLNDDNGIKMYNNYSYPSKLPTFLALIGIFELERWKQVSQQRKKLLKEIIKIFYSLNLVSILPSCYFDKKLDIIPLRLAFVDCGDKDIQNKIRNYIDVEWIWFKTPIVNIEVELEKYGYKYGNCPISENLGPRMINLPMNISLNYQNNFLVFIRNFFTKIY